MQSEEVGFQSAFERGQRLGCSDVHRKVIPPSWGQNREQRAVYPENQKFGGGKIMVWGYIHYGGAREICKVDGNIDSAKYQQILAFQYIRNYKRSQIFQQDGAPCHTSGSTMKFLRGKKIKVLQGWPAQSPDMNIIDHIWGRMKEESWRTKPKNLEELWDAFKVAFHAIPDDFINKLYNSLPNRMATVLQAKGTHTRY